MPSYLITGASRGIGLGFLDTLSANPSNTVIGLVRNVPATQAKISSWNRSNIHLVPGDLADYESLKSAVDGVSAMTDGRLDYVIANAGVVSDEFDPLSALGKDPKALTANLTSMVNVNLIGNIHLFNLFMPLVLRGDVKKVVTISTGMADTEMVRKYDIFESPLYSISKAAMNMAIAKFSAEYAKQGVLFLGISPGVVDSGTYSEISDEKRKKFMVMSEKFVKYQPEFKGPISVNESVNAVLSMVEKSSVAEGDGGAFYSHLGKGELWI
ncbi:NAD(P)-binding protein [Stemphylium lycopersici]|uniref:NAD(P)-binding protein n=1 Tax=Stemphylium lycopersici TaxID=183478 RepID=A0A364N2B4_STELY|nr:short chain dehydrogenase protein [Stemphylium lycopersici]RAR01597.1 NAD(P)-binding protein [Stemphylium lycopersici]RAR10188.1 NAD(P)-binding protein [Stemphylium lycopersici]